MNHHIQLRKGVLICGALEGDPECICLREEGHWSSHVVFKPTVGYFLIQTVCIPISFQITEAIAKVAMSDKDWSWPD